MLLVVREGHPLALGVLIISDQCHADTADSAGNGQAGQLGGGGSAVDSNDVVVLFRILGHHGDYDLDLVAQALDKGWAQRAVDKAACQDSFRRRTSLTAEKGAWNLAGRVHALFYVHSQRKEIESLARLVGRGGRGQQHGVIVQVGGHGAVCLPGQLTGFKAQGAGAKVTIV